MPKIRISMEKMSVSADIKEDAECLFIKFANELFCNSIGKENAKKITERLEKKKREHEAEDKKEGRKNEVEDENQIKYKGFIYWKCGDCGSIRGFCLNKESKGIHCMSCGSDHLFKEALRPIYAKCECGKSFRYLTNMKEESFDMDCINCGSPISIEWNEKKRIYETIEG